MDFSDTLTLEELARRLEPRAFTCWLTLSDILSGARERSLRHIRNENRREITKRRMWRKRLVDQYSLDDQLLPKVASDQTTVDWFQRKLCTAADLKTRQKLIVEEACLRARPEVREATRSRLKRARDRLGLKVLAAVSTALRGNGTHLSGIEIRPTLGGAALAERAGIASEHLVHAHIDILAGSLTDGGRQWRQVTVQLSQMSTACGATVASVKKAASEMTDRDIVNWMLVEQECLKGNGEEHGRDKLISLARKHFGFKTEVVRRAWDHRPGAPKRK